MSVARAPRGADLTGSLLAVAMGVLFAFVVIFGKNLLHGEPPFTLLCFRFGVTALLLALVAVITRVPLLAAPGERLGLALAGLFGYGVESALYFGALNHGSAAAVTLLFYLYPVWVMVVASLLDRRVPARVLMLALAMALAGGATVIVGGAGIDIATLGVVLAVLCSFAYTAYLIAADRVAKRSAPLTTGLWVAAGASLANLTFALASRTWTMPSGAAAPLRVFAMGAFTAGAFVCMIASLQRIGAVRNGIIGVLEPLTVAVLAALFLEEPITVSVVAGGALILGAGVLATIAGRPRIREPDI
jgi:drug/metabolite transporter (DMT)-like permease